MISVEKGKGWGSTRKINDVSEAADKLALPTRAGLVELYRYHVI
jgi:hypothetical protein